MRVEKQCKACKKSFRSYDVGRRIANNNCSKACSNISKMGEKVDREERTCPSCSAKFRVLRCISKIYCSPKCQHKSLRTLDLLSPEQQSDLLRYKYEKFVVKKDGCWEWNGATQGSYGCFTFMRKTTRAHRASWILHNGPIADDMHVLHKCDNPSCSNPDHLFLGSHKDNMRDMRSKGLHKQYSKLTLEQVKDIKSFLLGGEKVDAISKRYGVGFSTINDIKDGRTWKSIIL